MANVKTNQEVAIMDDEDLGYSASVMVMSPDEYIAWSKKQQKAFGRNPAKKLDASIEEVAMWIRHAEDSGLSKDDFIDKTGLTEEELDKKRVELATIEDIKSTAELPRWKSNKKRK
jgi:hypothetical protein